MKKILLLDTSFSVKPIYDYLLKTGNEVFLVGGNPSDALAKSVKNYINLDYSNAEDVKSLIKKLSIDYLVPGGNDLSYKICSEMSQELDFYNIDSIEVNEIINNKEKFRLFAYDINLHVPHIVAQNEINNHLPVIIKPVDGYSGHGTTVIYEDNNNKINDAINFAKKYSKTNHYLIEKFVQGQLYSHSAFIVNGEIIIDFIVEEHCIANKYVVDTSRVIFDFDKSVLTNIRKDITAMVKKLCLCDGLIHTQFIFDGTFFWLIEVTRRCPGDLYSKLIEFTTGFPYAEYYARPFIEQPVNITDINLNKLYVLRHTVTLDRERSFNSITFDLKVKILSYSSLALTGDIIKESPLSRIGLLFLSCNSIKEQVTLLNKLIDRNLYFIK